MSTTSQEPTYSIQLTKAEIELAMNILLHAPLQGSLETLPRTLEAIAEIYRKLQATNPSPFPKDSDTDHDHA